MVRRKDASYWKSHVEENASSMELANAFEEPHVSSFI